MSVVVQNLAEDRIHGWDNCSFSNIIIYNYLLDIHAYVLFWNSENVSSLPRSPFIIWIPQLNYVLFFISYSFHTVLHFFPLKRWKMSCNEVICTGAYMSHKWLFLYRSLFYIHLSCHFLLFSKEKISILIGLFAYGSLSFSQIISFASVWMSNSCYVSLDQNWIVYYRAYHRSYSFSF